MAVIVIYDVVTDRVLSHLRSANTPDYLARPDVVINPDLSVLDGFVPLRYWKHDTGLVVEMTALEQTQVDADAEAALTAQNRSEAIGITSEITGLGVESRAMIELLNKRDNYLTNRIVELQDALTAVKSSIGPADNIRDAIPASWFTTNTRGQADAIQDYTDDINSGNQDI